MNIEKTISILTAAELHAIYNGPWCPACGCIVDKSPHNELGRAVDRLHPTKPGLWDRAPQTRPPGIKYRADAGGFWLPRNGWLRLDDDDAALLCLGAAVATAPSGVIRDLLEIMRREDGTSIHHAVVSAWHRWLDLKEAKT